MHADVVVNEKNKARYTVDHYNLKVLKSTLPDLPHAIAGVDKRGFKSFDSFGQLEGETTATSSAPIVEEEVPNESFEPIEDDKAQSELIDSLLKKADEFSSKYLKAQMDYEDLETKSKEALELAKTEAFEAGKAESLQEMQEASNNKEGQVLEQLSLSIDSLNSTSSKFDEALKAVKQELVLAAVDIAKEVIQKELGENANDIALSLAQSLMQEISKDSKIELRVNPAQLELFTKNLGESERVIIKSDTAVSLGGVIIISNTGTIAADIMSRFEQVKRTVLSN